MKKVFLFFILISQLVFSAQKDKLGIMYAYQCKECIEVSKERCNIHPNSTFKTYLLKDRKILLDEFKKNEPRALHNYSKSGQAFIFKGVIRKLSSGITDDDLIIYLKDDTMIYIIKNDQEKYFNLNVGEQVFLLADFPTMSFSDLKFRNGAILSEELYNVMENSIENVN